MNFKNYAHLFFIATLALTACSKSSTNTPAPGPKQDTTVTAVTPVWETNADVYFVGTSTGVYPNNNVVATLWKNGVPSILPNSLSAFQSTATGIAVNGADVYVSGTINNRAVWWKNGIFTDLGHSNVQSGANAITVSNNDVYIAGYSDNKAVWWKNGILSAVINLDSARSATVANAITVSGTDVYMAGYIIDFYQGYFTPTVWKNGVATKLLQNNMTTGPMASAIAVNGNDVYVGGDTNDGATIWKNGSASTLSSTNNSTANAIIIKGNDVYVAGYINERSTVWKNGVATILPAKQGINSGEIGFSINGDNIYVANGVDADAGNSLYWRNGIAYPYYKGISQIYGIAIAPH